MNLLTALDAVYTDHRLCGGLDAGVDHAVVWFAFACDCGVSMARRATAPTGFSARQSVD